MKEFENMFLIRLAPVWLACRWQAMGHGLVGWYCKSDLQMDLLGMSDYSLEMGLVADAMLGRTATREWIGRKLGRAV